MTIEEYIKNHPDIKFVFKYVPVSSRIGGDKRFWRCEFSKPIKNNHLIGYACETYAELIDAIVNEKD